MAKLPIKYSHQGQDELFGLPIELMLPQNDPVHIVSAVLDSIDITPLHATYQGCAMAYDPRMMLKVIVYGYLCNIYLGRAHSKCIKRDINFI